MKLGKGIQERRKVEKWKEEGNKGEKEKNKKWKDASK